MATTIMQGDAYYLPLQIKNRATNSLITAANVILVEFTVGNLTKSYPGEVELSGTTFQFPLTQEETLAFSDYVKVQARPKFIDGTVTGVDFGSLKIKESVSKVVL